MFDKIVLTFLNGFGLVDTALSWVFSLVPDSNLFSFSSIIDNTITNFFTILKDVLTPISYWIDVDALLYYLFLTFWLEMTYVIIRFIVWLFVKILKP